MKSPALLSILVVCACLPRVAPGAVPTLETEKELIAAADIDGDGRQDVVIANKRAGTLRAVFGAAGGYTHLGPVAVAPLYREDADLITGLSLARFSGAGPLAAVLATPAAGALAVLALDKSTPVAFGSALIAPIPLQSIGPSKLVALPIGAPGAFPDLDGVLLGSSLNGSTHPGALENLKITAVNTLVSHATGNLSEGLLVRNANPVPFDRSQADSPYAGLLVGRQFDPPSLQIFDVSAAAANPQAPAIDQALPVAGYDHFVTGFFGAGLSPQVLVYRTGDPMIYAYPLTPGSPPSLGAPYFRNFFGSAVSSISIVRGQGSAPDRLIITFSFGPVRAGLYDYNGVDFPALVQSYAAPASGDFAGAVGLDNGDFYLFDQDAATGASQGFSRYKYNGTLVNSTTFPSTLPLSGRGNVIYYSATPLSDPGARVVAVLNSGDWAGGTPAAGPLPNPVTASREMFLGTAAGLGSSSVVSLGAPPATAAGVLSNQFAADVSAYNLGGAVGSLADVVSIDPPSGKFSSAISLEFTSAANASLAAAEPTHDIYYRIDAGLQEGSWQLYHPDQPPHLSLSGRVLAYSIPKAGGARSHLSSASYTFDQSGQSDSDEDGVPDHVEIGAGLNPTAGADSDGDGDSDLTELYAGTNPADPDSNLGRLSSQLRSGGLDAALKSFDLAVQVSTRYDHQGAKVDAVPKSGVAVSAQTFEGSLLATGVTATGGNLSSARLAGISPDSSAAYFTVSTAANYELEGYDGTGGREVLGLTPVPLPSHSLPEDFYNGGQDGLPASTENWVALLRAEFLPASGSFRLFREASASKSLPHDASAAQIKSALDYMSSQTGLFGAGDCIVTGEMPRFHVAAPAPAGHSATELTPVSYLSPFCQVLIIPKADSVLWAPVVHFDLLVMPAPPVISTRASVDDTLLALLVEKKLGSLLSVPNPTLFPMRAGDVNRTPLTPALIAGLATPGPGVPAYTLDGIVEPIRTQLTAEEPSPEVSALRQIAQFIYEFSSAQTSPGPVPASNVIEGFRSGSLPPASTPAARPAPVDALRAFLAQGTIDPTYTGQPAAGLLAQAAAGVSTLLGTPQARPTFAGILKVGYGSVLQPDDGSPGQSYWLYDRFGKPYSFDAAIPLQSGTRFFVQAYSDLEAGGLSFVTPLEVISVTLLSLPATPGEDSDGNLLADEWEKTFYGAIGQSPFAKGAGGKSLVQLYLDGDDPTLGSSAPAEELFPKKIELLQAPDGTFSLKWEFPEGYAPHFEYTLQSTFSLDTPFSDVAPAGSLSTAGDDNALPVAPASPTAQFWRLKLNLKR